MPFFKEDFDQGRRLGTGATMSKEAAESTGKQGQPKEYHGYDLSFTPSLSC
jgi:hypothetical protein